MSWEQLNSILKSSAQEQEQLANEPPVACPNDGTPLETGPHGGLTCPYDGWVYNQ